MYRESSIYNTSISVNSVLSRILIYDINFSEMRHFIDPGYETFSISAGTNGDGYRGLPAFYLSSNSVSPPNIDPMKTPSLFKIRLTSEKNPGRLLIQCAASELE